MEEPKEVKKEEGVTKEGETPSTDGKKMVQRDEKGRILPGSVLNPVGTKPGTKQFFTIFKELLQEEYELKGHGKMTAGKAMSKSMIMKAIRGDVKAFEAVADRVDGKPHQSTDITSGGKPIPILGALLEDETRAVNDVSDNNGNQEDIETPQEN